MIAGWHFGLGDTPPPGVALNVAGEQQFTPAGTDAVRNLFAALETDQIEKTATRTTYATVARFGSHSANGTVAEAAAAGQTVLVSEFASSSPDSRPRLVVTSDPAEATALARPDSGQDLARMLPPLALAAPAVSSGSSGGGDSSGILIGAIGIAAVVGLFFAAMAGAGKAAAAPAMQRRAA